MSKYDKLKSWAKVKARVIHHCQACGHEISPKMFYYKQRIELVNPPPGMRFGELCEECYRPTTR